jgi:hypothetical protein
MVFLHRNASCRGCLAAFAPAYKGQQIFSEKIEAGKEEEGILSVRRVEKRQH